MAALRAKALINLFPEACVQLNAGALSLAAPSAGERVALSTREG